MIRNMMGDIGGATMITLNLTCLVLLTLLLLITLLGSSVELFFSRDELNEMGIRIYPSEFDGGTGAA